MSHARLDRLLGGPQLTLDVWRFSFVAIYWNKHGRGVVAESRAETEDFKAFNTELRNAAACLALETDARSE